MSGLVNYGSSDEDEEVIDAPPAASSPAKPATDLRAPSPQSIEDGTNGHAASPAAPADLNGPLVGPALGPAMPDADTAASFALDELPDDDGDEPAEPQSPYSAQRATLRTLTLPPMQNRDIPPSPPGSPNPSTQKKFERFLELKQQGVHFNDKLARSAPLRNPSLTEKLMEFAGFDAADEYATTLPPALWDPRIFPPYAYKDALGKSQTEIRKKREEDKARGRDSIDFVAATSGDSSRTSTPGPGRSTGRSTAERVISGLDRGRTNVPPAGVKRKTRFDS